jgi:hypothetical protein
MPGLVRHVGNTTNGTGKWHLPLNIWRTFDSLSFKF